MAFTLGTLVTAQPESIQAKGGDVELTLEATAISKKTFVLATYRIDPNNPYVFRASDEDDAKAVTGEVVSLPVDPHDVSSGVLSLQLEPPTAASGKFVTIAVEVAEVGADGERVRLPSGRLKSVQKRRAMIPIEKR
jgi:hypothetical protein